MSTSSSSSFPSLVELFDSICLNYGEYDAVAGSTLSVCYLEIQHASNLLADQLFFRYGRPTMALLDLNLAAAAELAAVIACLRLGILFVPVDGTDPFRLHQTVDLLRKGGSESTNIVAIVVADTDADPRLSSFYHAGIHFCLLVNERGDMVEPMTVPSLPDGLEIETNDDMYILCTSGTTNGGAVLKAVVGSNSQTLRRLRWFADEIQRPGQTIIARRTPLTFVDGVHELLSALLTTPRGHEPGHFYCSEHLHDLVQHSTRITMLPSQLGQVLCSSVNQRSPLRTIVISGEPCPPSILEQFRSAQEKGNFAQDICLFNLYGQTETVGDVCFTSLLNQNDPVIVQDTVPVGLPLPGVTMRLDEDTNEVIVTGGSFANGYFNNRGESSPLKLFRTGDLGFYVGHCLYIKGRIGDVQKVNGILTSPTEIETRFRQVFGDDCSCAATIQLGSPYILVVKGTMKKDFSREAMREERIPWHLIPKSIFVTSLPLPKTASGKVQRSQVHRIVAERLLDCGAVDLSPALQDDDLLLQAIAWVLRLPLTGANILEMKTRSFIELGGDSHLAVALWHRLHAMSVLHKPTGIRPKDLLGAGSIEDMRHMLNLGLPPKKRRKTTSTAARTELSYLKTISDKQAYAQFLGCVDATPIFKDGFVYGACQSGTIQRFAASTGSKIKYPIDSLSLDDGWRIQASLTPIEGGIIACCHHVSDDFDLVVCVTPDLEKVVWKHRLQHSVKATPLLRDGNVFLHSGQFLVVLETLGGNVVSQYKLKGESECSPALAHNDKNIYLYAFSNWGSVFEIVNLHDPMFISSHVIEYGEGAPIRSNPLVLGTSRVLAVDILGYVHDVATKSGTLKSVKISSVPGALASLSEGQVVLSCHDGWIHCLHESNLSIVLWTIDLRASIRSSVVRISEDAFLACTTAGGVFVVSTEAKSPSFRKVGQVAGEIWSSALDISEQCSSDEANARATIVFGGRDSKIHLIRI